MKLFFPNVLKLIAVENLVAQNPSYHSSSRYKMLLDVRDTAIPIPTSFVPTYVAEYDISMEIGIFVATLIVYDAREYLFSAIFVTRLSYTSKSSHLTKRYLSRLLLPDMHLTI